MNLPEITVVICVYNRGNFIRNCLDSVISQSCPLKEIIVVNDGSTDDTTSILEEFSSSGKIRLITNPTNMGLMKSRNIGAREALGKIIAYTDSDCLADTNWLHELSKSFASHVDITICGGKISDPEVDNYWGLVMKGAVFVSRESGYTQTIRGGNMAIKKDFLLSNPFDETLKYGADETDLCFRALEQNKKIYYNNSSETIHYHRNDTLSLIKQQFCLGIANYYVRLKHGIFPFTSIKSVVLLLAAILRLTGSILPSTVMLLLYVGRVFYEDLRPHRKNLFQLLISMPGMILVTFIWDIGNIYGIFKIAFLKICKLFN